MQRFAFVISAFLLCVAGDKYAPEIHTKLGSLRGKYESVKGTDTGVHAYLGVPFAKPPVGPALRLAAPQPVEGWEGVRDATKQPLMCVQDLEFANGLVETFGLTVDLPDISEDCLYLNIYTPANRPDNAKLPVMVWIHGGGFVLGSASSYSGSALAAYQDVVVVVIQYRLGLLGFLSTRDEHMPGNIGFLDQIQALKWVQEHIHNFGGDPNLVTIFGESAGGVSVSLLLLSPLSEGLFHRAIAESGTAAMQLLVQDDPQPALQMVANISGCSTESTEKTADCIKKLDMENILTIAKEKELRYPLITDGYFLKNNVEELFLQHQLLDVPFMTGVNNHEGSWLLAQYFAPPNWTEGMDQEHVLGMLSMFYPDPKDEQLRKQILDVYTGTGEDRVKNRDGYTETLGDVLFVIPAIKAANAHRDAGASVYLYEFQHSPSFLKDKRPSFVRSDHGDEIYSVFGFCFTVSHIKFSSACSEEDEQLDRIMMSYWGNFARTGSPNGQGLVHWPKYGEKEDYLAIDAKNQNVFQGLKKDKFVVLTQTPPENFKEKKRLTPEIQTKLGSLRGKYESIKGKDTGVHAYLGVPFAKPPVGPALRLAAPQPVEGWEGVRDATKQPLMCIQDLGMSIGLLETVGFIVDLPDISEDCLYLNVYTPANRPENAKLPVMVWIHGGGFVLGSASMYSGSALAAYQDVVVVVIQYRLGLLGFLSTGDEYMSGNIGLLDQIQALKWVQEHIHNFGGDPDLVTIFGESAGGVSVSLLLLSPLSEGLFHRAIAESGTAALQLLFQDDPQHALQMVANISGCSTESTEKTADCIKKLDMENILTIAQEKELRYPLITDGYFLKNNVEELFLQHQLLDVPFMTGVNNHEGSWLLPQYMAPPNWTEGMDQEHVLGMLSMFYPDPKDEQLRKQILDVYTGTGEDRVKNRDGYTEMLGDVLFVIPAIKAANAHRDASAPVYLYEFQHSPSFLKDKRPSFVRSDHGDEIFSVFGFCFTVSHIKLGSACSEEDEQLDKIMMSYWGNFARTGSPNGQGLVHWPKYGEKEDYLAIDAKNQNVFQGLKKDKFVVLTQILPEDVKEQKDTTRHTEF
ncbi:uncharacterized protein ces2b isoform X2 [Takifugu rubripes]|uniref:uncharacterized protein ces2b isoform X2 n=1 Tax=Takifugu rubripes TaxID=31033 RepID=UPI001145FAEE|nr:uncharacterized protein LOC101072925 isoform X2 [Takifugu rubripes]